MGGFPGQQRGSGAQYHRPDHGGERGGLDPALSPRRKRGNVPPSCRSRHYDE
jgi:hypothetical protein